jgi:hypothetical protein
MADTISFIKSMEGLATQSKGHLFDLTHFAKQLATEFYCLF